MRLPDEDIDRPAQPARRSVLAGLTALGLTATAKASVAAPAVSDPDLGSNVFIIDPSMPGPQVQARLDAIFREQERAHFTDQRHAILFKPGRYAADVNIGFFTQVAGLGRSPRDVVIDGQVHVEADWNGGTALVNFWRGAENLSVRPPGGADRWAVSQAASYRRIHLHGDLALDDGGFSSGGFMADCRIDGVVRSGSQQQWFTRNSVIRAWQGSTWNMMFMGVHGAPATSFPDPPFTTIAAVPRLREKPFLYIDAMGAWQVFVPAVRQESNGVSWENDASPGRTIPLSRFLIARPEMTAREINAALGKGRHVLLTPGVYRLSEPIRVKHAHSVILGLGLATLLAERGNKVLTVADVPGVVIAGLLIDAGPVNSPVLMQVGPRGSSGGHRHDPTSLHDIYFRVGGAAVGKANICLEINSRDVLGDHLWIWRADHGDPESGRVHVGWDESTGDHGLIVNGDDVSIFALFVEHFQKYQTIWRGERGRVYFYQNEIPYDPPNQAAYMAGRKRGWAAYKVADRVRDHQATALGIYVYFTADPGIVVDSAIEAPKQPEVRFTHVTTVSLGGNGTIRHLVNDTGDTARPGAVRQTLVRYPAPG
jgi:hypothetical protein